MLTGLDAAGRSCIICAHELPEATGQHDAFTYFEVALDQLESRPTGSAAHLDLGVSPGTLRWTLLRWAPHAVTARMHHTDTIDLDLVVSGSITLSLDDGAHPMEPGDSVVISGVDHTWKAGPDGCTLALVFIGTPPPSA